MQFGRNPQHFPSLEFRFKYSRTISLQMYRAVKEIVHCVTRGIVKSIPVSKLTHTLLQISSALGGAWQNKTSPSDGEDLVQSIQSVSSQVRFMLFLLIV